VADPSSSRRSFLFGRSLKVDDPWLRFLQRLRRTCEGKVGLLARDGVARARLEPARLEDVLHALSLCREYGVCMALEGVPIPDADMQRPMLEVEAGRAWGSLTPLSEGLWRVQAGCPIEVMRAAGLALAPVTRSVRNAAQWIAMLEADSRVGGLERYGVEAVECLFPDGSIEVLGLFGVHDSQPLQSMAAQRCVPALFELTMRPLIEQLLLQVQSGSEPTWPLVFRLDALMNLPGSSVNLAHLMLGHHGCLGWVVAMHLRADRPGHDMVSQSSPSGESNFSAQDLTVLDRHQSGQQCRDFEQEIRRVIDPEGVFLSCPDQTG